MAERGKEATDGMLNGSGEVEGASPQSAGDGPKNRRRAPKKKIKVTQSVRVPLVVEENPGMSEAWRSFYLEFCKNVSS